MVRRVPSIPSLELSPLPGSLKSCKAGSKGKNKTWSFWKVQKRGGGAAMDIQRSPEVGRTAILQSSAAPRLCPSSNTTNFAKILPWHFLSHLCLHPYCHSPALKLHLFFKPNPSPITLIDLPVSSTPFPQLILHSSGETMAKSQILPAVCFCMCITFNHNVATPTHFCTIYGRARTTMVKGCMAHKT